MSRFEITFRRHVERKSMMVLSGKDEDTVRRAFMDLLGTAEDENWLGIDFTDGGPLDHIQAGDEIEKGTGVIYKGKQRKYDEDETELQLKNVRKLTKKESEDIDKQVERE